jgi:hypothetical protein
VHRFTFVLQVHPDGVSTLESLASEERVPIADLAEVAPQVERWLEALAPATRDRATSASSSDPSAPAPPPRRRSPR